MIYVPIQNWRAELYLRAPTHLTWLAISHKIKPVQMDFISRSHILTMKTKVIRTFPLWVFARRVSRKFY